MKRLVKSIAVRLPTPLRLRLFRNRLWILRELATNPESPYSLEGFHRFGCVFFHIPKTAGLAVAEALFGNWGAVHIRPHEAEILVGPRRFESYYKFAFVRNPYDRLVSAYRYLRQGGSRRHISPWIAEHISPYPTFEAFVCSGLDHVLEDIYFRPQHTWIYHNGDSVLDFLGRYEELEHGFAAVCRTLGVKKELERVNPSDRRTDYAEYYDEEVRAKVEDVYGKDLELFGYRF